MTDLNCDSVIELIFFKLTKYILKNFNTLALNRQIVNRKYRAKIKIVVQ